MFNTFCTQTHWDYSFIQSKNSSPPQHPFLFCLEMTLYQNAKEVSKGRVEGGGVAVQSLLRPLSHVRIPEQRFPVSDPACSAGKELHTQNLTQSSTEFQQRE